MAVKETAVPHAAGGYASKERLMPRWLARLPEGLTAFGVALAVVIAVSSAEFARYLSYLLLVGPAALVFAFAYVLKDS